MVTTDQVLFGVGLLFVLAVGSQIVAGLVRIPALVVLLPVGFVAGALTDDLNPDRLLGNAFQPLVSLAVAVILYDAGLGLDLRRLLQHRRRVVVRLIVFGMPLTWLIGGAVSAAVLSMSREAAVMLGAILVVSGPTVVGPLLAFVRPRERVSNILGWEGSLIDPVGGILGAVVFTGIVASTKVGSGAQVGHFGVSTLVGLAGGAVGLGMLWLVLVKLRVGEVRGTMAQLAIVIAVAAACDMVKDDAGLLAAIVMGMGAAYSSRFDIPDRRPFFETLVQLIIGLLFISISATVTPASLSDVIAPGLLLVAALVLVARPLVAWLSTVRTGLPTAERAFIGWMAPRGIVAAATAATFAPTLAGSGIGGADRILPATFLVIVLTVTLYGLSAQPVARTLRITEDSPGAGGRGEAR